MKKLVPVLAIAMVLALAFTVAANAASDNVYVKQADGLYDINFDLGTAADGTMYGMVVIEAGETPATFELTQDNIRYIDQSTSQDNTLSFTDVGPMDLKNSGTYYVYIGGGSYTAAERIGTLSATGTTPEPPATQTFTVTFVADGTTVETKVVNVGESLEVSAFPEVPDKSGFTGAWDVNEAITEETTVNAVYTPVTTPDPGEGDDEVLGDMDGNGVLDDDDAIHLLFHYLIDEEKYPLSCDGDVDGSGSVDDDDAIHLLFHYLIDEEKYPLYPNK